MELAELLKELVERKGSDLHLVAGSAPVIRVNGELMALILSTATLGTDDVGALFDRYLTDAQNRALRSKQDIHTSIVSEESFRTERGSAIARFRACLFWDRNGISASLRVIPTKIPELGELFTPKTENTFRKLINLRRGLTIVVGPTGSGKSTTTATFINAINAERSERIFTVEDPIEYIHASRMSLISQREVGTDVESYEQGGISVMRADPDVVLVGELRTAEAVRIAVVLADTGHLVFATMHADSVSEVVRRLIETFPESRETMQAMIARSLNSVISQRLVPRANGKGRAPIHEIMIVNSRIRRLISEGKTDLSLAIEAGRDEGMCSMDDNVLTLYRDGTISHETAWHWVQDRGRLGPAPALEEPTSS